MATIFQKCQGLTSAETKILTMKFPRELNDTEQKFKTNHTSLEIEKLLSPLDGDEISEISDTSNESNDFSSSSAKSIISNLSQLEEIVNQKIKNLFS